MDGTGGVGTGTAAAGLKVGDQVYVRDHNSPLNGMIGKVAGLVPVRDGRGGGAPKLRIDFNGGRSRAFSPSHLKRMK